jgi:hypothetical protein
MNIDIVHLALKIVGNDRVKGRMEITSELLEEEAIGEMPTMKSLMEAIRDPFKNVVSERAIDIYIYIYTDHGHYEN